MPTSPRQIAIITAWAHNGGNIKATAKYLAALGEYNRCTPEVVRQAVAKYNRLGELPTLDPDRVALAEALAKTRGDTQRTDPEILEAAAQLDINPSYFRSSWPARSQPIVGALDCPHCKLSDRVRPNPTASAPARWLCLSCNKQFIKQK